MKFFYTGLIALLFVLVLNCKNQTDTDSAPSNVRLDNQGNFDEKTEFVIKTILDRRNELQKQYGNKKVEFAIFCDFDGTIISGDITDGGNAETQKIEKLEPYIGMAKLAFDNGLWNNQNHKYDFKDMSGSNKTPFEIYQETSEKMVKASKDHGSAYEWSAGLFANLETGASVKLVKLRDEHFINVLNKHLFSSSVQYIKELHDNGIQVYIVSASPTIFVDGARKFFGNYIPATDNHATGINLAVDKKGNRIDPITNYAQGKTDRIKKIVNDAAGKGKTIIVLAGFGNSWNTDGAFLRYVASKEVGGVSVMINGGDLPDQNENTLNVIRIKQQKLIGTGVNSISELKK